MKLRLNPAKIQGVVTIPPSKSVAHRSLLAAALAEGVSKISNLVYSQDMEATLSAIAQLGASVQRREDFVIITGNGGIFPPVTEKVDCHESGSTLRFLIPLMTHSGSSVTFTGRGRLMQRPQEIYQELFLEKGLTFVSKEQELTISGQFQSGEFRLDGSVSSQFITGLLFTLPLLDGDSTIHIAEPFESRSYVELTRQTLNDFGVETCWLDRNTLKILGGQKFVACDYLVEGDCSQAAFWAVLGALSGGITLHGVRPDTLQGDRVIFDLLKKAGAICREEDGVYHYEKSHLKGTEIDLADCPDLGPILMIMALFAEGETKIFNAGRLRVKESDRIAAMESEILKMGGNMSVDGDTITITQSKLRACSEICSHNDHRIAMSMAIASMSAEATICLSEAESVSKSYPNFFDVLQACGAIVEKLEN